VARVFDAGGYRRRRLLKLVQLQNVCGRPRYNIAKFGDACVNTFSRDNEVRVVNKLEESVAGIKRLDVSGCDSIIRWS